MDITPFHAYYKSRLLTSYTSGKDKLLAVYASSDIKVYPYQIAAAQFALRSPYLKGVVLCDDGALGKSYEAMLIMAQEWYAGKKRILIVLPTHLVKQWYDLLNDRFSVPYTVIDNEETFNAEVKETSKNPFDRDAIIITTYDFAAEKEDAVKEIQWDVAAFDEAHRLCSFYKGDNKTANSLDASTDGAYRMLLTAIPMLRIMDLYGLVKFIDKNEFGDSDAFYKRYHQHRENYPELAKRISKYFFRTQKSQVRNYVQFTKRIIATPFVVPTPKEKQLYDMLMEYMQNPVKYAYPKAHPHNLTYDFTRTLASSTFAFAVTLKGMLEKLDENHPNPAHRAEYKQIKEMYDLCLSIKDNARGNLLLKALDKAFARLWKLGAARKALIFTESTATQKYLYNLLNKGKYKGKVLTYNGQHSRDYNRLKRFETEAQILISTDLAAEGPNLEFCSFVVNYDLPDNALLVEQRINRADRQEQKNDVFVLNFITEDNYGEARTLELFNKRILDFDGIIGMSEDVLGNFGIDIDKNYDAILEQARTQEDIIAQFVQTLHEHETENKELIEESEQMLYTSFTRQIADKVGITPEYVEDKSKEINDDLWAITKYFFKRVNHHHIIIDDNTRTILSFEEFPRVFTGAKMGRHEYSMDAKYQPRSGRHTITGSLAGNIIREMSWRGIYDRGSVQVDRDIDPCEIGFYEIKVKPKNSYFGSSYCYKLIGRTRFGKILSNEQCGNIMKIPVIRHSEHGNINSSSNVHYKISTHDFDELIVQYFDECREKALSELNPAVNEQVETLFMQAEDLKLDLERGIEDINRQLKTVTADLAKTSLMAEKMKLQKQRSLLDREFKQKSNNLFMDKIKLEERTKQQAEELKNSANLEITAKQLFIINVSGGSQNG